jgi:serine/threonine protein kinase
VEPQEYISFEVIMTIGHGRAADWYKVEILLHELTEGHPPFYNAEQHDLFQKILKDPMPFPSMINN